MTAQKITIAIPKGRYPIISNKSEGHKCIGEYNVDEERRETGRIILDERKIPYVTIGQIDGNVLAIREDQTSEIGPGLRTIKKDTCIEVIIRMGKGVDGSVSRCFNQGEAGVSQK